MIQILRALAFILVIFDVKAGITQNTAYTNTMDVLKEFILRANETKNSEQCKKDLRHLLDGLVNQEVWAQMMIDSQQWMPPSGLMIGRRHMIGRYEECLDYSPENDTFTTQYCLIQVDIPAVHSYYLTLPDEPLEGTLYYGACTPLSCTSEILNTTLNTLEVPLTDLHINDYIKFTVKSQNCHSNGEPIKFTNNSWLLLGILAALSSIAILCTIYTEVKMENTSAWAKSFSILENWDIIQKESNSSVVCATGISCLGTMWMMAGSVGRLFFLAPIVNSQDVYEMMETSGYMSLNNSHFGEDMLLLTAGLGVALKFNHYIRDKNGYDHALAFLKRYTRWTVPLGIFVFFVASMATHCGSGPTWRLTMDKVSEPCNNNWHFVILYVQNYVENVRQCLRQTWILAVEMQLFVLSPIILVPMLWQPAVSIILAGLGAVAAAALEFYLAQEHDLAPTYNFTRNSNHILIDYLKTHTRAAPWFIGCCLGLIIVCVRNKTKKLKIPTAVLACGWIFALGLLCGSFCSILFFDRQYQQPYAAIALAVNRLAWGLGVSWVIFTCATGHSEPVNILLSWRPFQFLNKLTFAIIITHELVIQYYIGLTRELQHIYTFRLFCYFCALYLIGMIVSVLILLFIALPSQNVGNLLLEKVKIYQIIKKTDEIQSNGVETEAIKEENAASNTYELDRY